MTTTNGLVTESGAVTKRGCHHCGAPIFGTHLYCRSHWHALPLVLRNAVFTTYRMWKKTRGNDARLDYINAIRACRSHLQAEDHAHTR